MAENSKIEWTEHTFNPWWGCVKISEGCARCYAEGFAKRTGFAIWGQEAERRYFGDKHWAEPLKWNDAAAKLGVMHRVFCGSMCDILEDRDDVSMSRYRAFELAEATPNLLWLFLTKRAENAARMYPERWKGNGKWPRNVMAGFTIENQERLDERVPHIAEFSRAFLGAQIFASCEPLLSPLDWTPPECRSVRNVNQNDWLKYFRWIVGGGESGPKARPCHPLWARKLRNDCESRDDMCRPWPLPFLWKQWGEWMPSLVRGDIWECMAGIWPQARMGSTHDWKDGYGAVRVGKKTAGRLLDGKEHNGIPRLTYGPQVQEAAYA